MMLALLFAFVIAAGITVVMGARMYVDPSLRPPFSPPQKRLFVIWQCAIGVMLLTTIFLAILALQGRRL